VPLITVGIPVYNAMPYLQESVESLLAQTYREFELLVIDDGSTDDSLAYLQSLRDPRIRVVHQENRGLTTTLNRMLVEARSPWLVRHDADDVALPHRLARTIEYIGKYPQSGMFCSLAEYFPKECCGLFRGTRGGPEDFRSLVLGGYLPTICHPTVTLNVNRTIAAGGYRFDLYVEDIDLWWRMALSSDIQLIPEVLLGFRQNLKSISSANLAKQSLHTLYVQYLLLSHLWNLEPLAFDQACPHLSQLIDHNKLEFKTRLRGFNIELGRQNRAKAVVNLAAAFISSPAGLVRRVLDEYISDRVVSLGEDPELFAKHLTFLWPNAVRNVNAAWAERTPQMAFDRTAH
jgi:hypothetical protein